MTTPLSLPSPTEPFLVMQDVVQFHASYQQTAGDFSVMEVTVAPGGGPPPLHTHPAAEFFWTLDGELTYYRQDPDGLKEFTGGPGTNAFIPSGAPHTYRNHTDRPARYIAVLSPPQLMQDFLVAAGVAPGEPLRSTEEVLAIGERYGVVMLDVVPGPLRG